jgi:hypothetical protein
LIGQEKSDLLGRFDCISLLKSLLSPKATKFDRDDPILLEEGIEGDNKSRN